MTGLATRPAALEQKTEPLGVQPLLPRMGHGAVQEGSASATPRLARLLPWVWDGLALGYLLSGGYAYDARLALGTRCSLNQLLAAALFARLVWCSRGRLRLRVRARTTLVALLALTAALLFGLPRSWNPEYGSVKLLSYLLLVLPVAVHAESSVREPSDARRLVQLNVLAAVTLLVLSLPHMWALQPGQRLAVWGGGPNVFARLVGAGVLSASCFLEGGTPRRRRVRGGLLVVSCMLAVLGMLLAGSKAVLLSTALAGMVLLHGSGRKRLVRGIAVAFVLCLAAPILTHSIVSSAPKDGGLVRLLRLPDVHDAFGSYGSRLRYLQGSWAQIRTHPWLGVGTGGWGARLGLGIGPWYPHNLVLETLSELGLLGVLVFVLPFLAYPSPRFEPGSRWRRPGIALVALASFWLVNVQLSGDLVDSRYLWWYLVLLEIVCRAANDEAKTARARANEEARTPGGLVPCA